MKKALSILVLACAGLAGCGGSNAPSSTSGSAGGETSDSGSSSGSQGGSSTTPSATTSPGGAGAKASTSASGSGGGTGQGGGGSSASAASGGASKSSSTAIGGSVSTSTGGSGTSGGAGGSTGGNSDSAGSKSSGGSSAAGGTTASSTAQPGGASGNCGGQNPKPFGCKFAWGLSANMTGSLSAYSYLNFMTIWIETGIKADGTFTSCTGCNWLKNSVAPTDLIPVYYAYIIGFLGHANGLVDGNQCPASNPNCPNLTTGGAALIKSKRSQIVSAYAEYAKQSYAAWPTKPLVWLLEGDYIQFNDAGQSSPLSMTELVQLAADVTCAIKSNMPNAVVAINHTVWNSDQETKEFWNGMKAVNYDLAWTTGVANNNGFIPSGTSASTYNGATAKYSVIHQLTGKPILVDDGCGANTNEDWSRGPASVLNARIADGVIAFNHCVTQSSTFQSQIAAIMPQASATCH